MVAGIAVTGNDHTSERLVREQLEMSTRSSRSTWRPRAVAPQSLRHGSLLHRRYHARGTRGGQTETADWTASRCNLNVSVREVQPIQLRYGVSYDTERGLGGIFDVSNHNMLGKARVIGLRSRYDAQLREVARLTSANRRCATGRFRRRQASTAPRSATDRDRITGRVSTSSRQRRVDSAGARARQLVRLELRVSATNAHARFDPAPGGSARTRRHRHAADQHVHARNARRSARRDTRLVLVAGVFVFALVARVGPGVHQVLRPVLPLHSRCSGNAGNASRTRFCGRGSSMPVGVRLGLARGFGGLVPRSERFFAGGSTTLRGFEQNAAGPIGIDGRATRGRCDARHQQRTPRSACEHLRWRRLQRCGQRVSTIVATSRFPTFAKRPGLGSACERAGSCCAEIMAFCSIDARGSAGDASISASDRRSEGVGSPLAI